MPNLMQCSNHQSYTQDQMIVLDLEKKYFEILYKIFSSIQFQDELKSLINDINRRWERIYTHWGKENVVDLAVERHINYMVYNHKLLKGKIQTIYPSVISSDTAFVTSDAVINIDSKTVNVAGNPRDWTRQNVGCNQTSFDNKMNFYAPDKKINVQIGAFLASENHHGKPVLSYFLSTLFHSDKQKKMDSWYDDSKHSSKPYNKKNKNKSRVNELFLNNIKFACMPNAKVSSLYNYDIVSGVKGYVPPNVPNPSSTASVRVQFESLKNRFDSKGRSWDGVKEWKI